MYRIFHGHEIVNAYYKALVTSCMHHEDYL